MVNIIVAKEHFMMFWIMVIISIITALISAIVLQINGGGSTKSKAINEGSSTKSKPINFKVILVVFLGCVFSLTSNIAANIAANWLYDYMASIPSNETGDDNNSNIADINIDGKVTTVDAKWVLQAVSGSRTLTPEQETAADVNGDGKITTVDAKWILQAVSGSRKLS